MSTEYACLSCGHGFPWFTSDGPYPACPRCGRTELEANLWLLCRDSTEGLSDEDHFLAGLVV